MKMGQESVDVTVLRTKGEQLRSEDTSITHLAVGGRFASILAVTNAIKSNTHETIEALHRSDLCIGMATGDGLATARSVASKLGADEVHGDVKSADKLALVEKLQIRPYCCHGWRRYQRYLPALARANTDLVMGTDTAIETADVALMDDDLRKISAFIRLP